MKLDFKHIIKRTYYPIVLLILIAIFLLSNFIFSKINGLSVNQTKLRNLWRVYESDDLSFYYPADLNNLKLKVEYGVTMADYEYSKTLFGDVSPFEISFYPKNYELITDPFGGRSDIFSKPIDVNSAEKDLKTKYTTMDEIVGYKKLSDKSVLVIKYGAYECSPNWSINVIAPIVNSQKYSNIEISVSEKPVYVRPDSYEQGFECSYRESIESLAKGIVDGTADSMLLENIEKAKKIAESVLANN